MIKRGKLVDALGRGRAADRRDRHRYRPRTISCSNSTSSSGLSVRDRATALRPRQPRSPPHRFDGDDGPDRRSSPSRTAHFKVFDVRSLQETLHLPRIRLARALLHEQDRACSTRPDSADVSIVMPARRRARSPSAGRRHPFVMADFEEGTARLPRHRLRGGSGSRGAPITGSGWSAVPMSCARRTSMTGALHRRGRAGSRPARNTRRPAAIDALEDRRCAQVRSSERQTPKLGNGAFWNSSSSSRYALALDAGRGRWRRAVRGRPPSTRQHLPDEAAGSSPGAGLASHRRPTSRP